MPWDTLLAAALLGLGLWIARADHATTLVPLWALAAFAALAALWAVGWGGAAHGRTAALLGGAVATGLGLAIRWWTARRTGREGFGEADVWILGAGGAVLGISWLGVWIGLAAAVGLALVAMGQRRPDALAGDGAAILPFLPTLLATLALLALGLHTGLLPRSPF